MATSGRFIDVWKFGWGTAYLDPGIEAKLALLAEHDRSGRASGGTLLEVAWSQDKVAEFLAWAEALGFPCIEVSRGGVAMPLDEKRDLIRLACKAGRIRLHGAVGGRRQGPGRLGPAFPNGPTRSAGTWPRAPHWS